MAEKGFGTRVEVRADPGPGWSSPTWSASLDELADRRAAVRQR